MADENVVDIRSRAKQAPWYIQAGVTRLTRYEGQQFARSIVESEDYRNTVTSRAKTGTLPAAVECLLLQMAYGKPVEQVEVAVQTGAFDYSKLSTSELVEGLDRLRDQMREAQALEDAIPAEYTEEAV